MNRYLFRVFRNCPGARNATDDVWAVLAVVTHVPVVSYGYATRAILRDHRNFERQISTTGAVLRAAHAV